MESTLKKMNKELRLKFNEIHWVLGHNKFFFSMELYEKKYIKLFIDYRIMYRVISGNIAAISWRIATFSSSMVLDVCRPQLSHNSR